jgi:hypothetical protein
MDKLLLVTPPENAKEARDISGLSHLEVLRIVAEANDLAFNADQPGKIYIGLKAKPTPVKTQPKDGGLFFPLAGTYLERHPENNHPDYQPYAEAAPPLVKGPDGTKLSEHFTLGEFRPKSNSYTGVRVHPELVEALEDIRHLAGGPIRITSAYRPPAYNRKVGGVSNSTHIDGLAADIYADNLTTKQLYDIADRVIGSGGGVGYYPVQGFVHIDVRGHRSRW